VKRRIDLLVHEADTPEVTATYAIAGLAEAWAEAGLEVRWRLGPGGDPDADLVVVHVDLSEVPEAYLALAARYPRAVNGKVRSIRKSAFSEHLLRPGDPWEGPVIVKTDRNFGGMPEALRGVPRLDGRGLRPVFEDPLAYPVYRALAEVPAEVFACADLVVQKFLPERREDLFAVRTYQFLGDRSTCILMAGPHPVVKSETRTFTMPAAVHPDVLAFRERLGFDYGKFDYVEREGRALVLDVNKTPGAARVLSPQVLAARRVRAEGIHSFLPAPRA
jgi:hypothetical protein